MTDREIIYNALGVIEGLACVSQRNMRDAFMEAINMIKDAIENNEDDEDNSDRNCSTCYASDMKWDEIDCPCWNCKGNYSRWKPKED